MTAATANQTRRVALLADGRTAYEVTTRVVDAGALPTKSLFVVSINDPLNPKADALARITTPMDLRRISGALHVRVDAADIVYVAGDPFARVANLADFTALVEDRAEAVRRGASVYLTSAITVLYEDPTTADAAYRQLLARLSALVDAWSTYRTSFETAPTQSYALPITAVSIEEERRAAYDAARRSRQRAEGALAVAQTAYEACDTGCATNRAVHALLVADVGFLERAALVAGGIAEVGTTNVKDFVLRQGAYASNDESYAVLLAAKRTALADYASRLAACAETCAQRRTERDEAQAEVSRARADENRALAAVRAVCPTFVPTE